jgi:DNA-binding CsgD family transcriptional regulator
VYQELFVKHYGSVNPWTSPEKAHLWTPGSVIEGRELISEPDLLKTEFYNGFLKPQGWFSAIGGAITRNNSVGAYITALRKRSVHPDTGRELLGTLMPHLQCAMRLHERIAGLDIRLSALANMIDYLPGGIIIADSRARVLVMNRAAEQILAGDHGLKNGPTGLSAVEANETAKLSATIAQAVMAREGSLSAPTPLAITRGEMRRPLQLLIAPLPAQEAGTRRQPAAVLFVFDPDENLEPNLRLLRKVFSLTEAEARIAAALAQGDTVEQIADQTGVTLNTIRTHLKKVYSKTGTRGQTEFVRLVLTSWSTVRIKD